MTHAPLSLHCILIMSLTTAIIQTHVHYLKLSRTPSLRSHLYRPSFWYHPPDNTWDMISVCKNECFFFVKSLKHFCKLSKIHLSPWISEKQQNSNQHQRTQWPLPALTLILDQPMRLFKQAVIGPPGWLCSAVILSALWLMAVSGWPEVSEAACSQLLYRTNSN